MDSHLAPIGGGPVAGAEGVAALAARMTGPTRYWWRRWLPLLGWERWFLVTVLRWMHQETAGNGGETPSPSAKAMVEFTVPSLAERLGMSESALYRLLKSEKIDDGTRWRRLAVRESAKNPMAEEQVKRLRRFIPRLRYTAEYDPERGTTVRRGMAVEVVLGDVLTASDADRLGLPPSATVSQAYGGGGASSGSSDREGARGALTAEMRTGGRAQTAEKGNGGAQKGVSGKLLLTDVPYEEVGVPARTHVCTDVEALRNGVPTQPRGIDAAVAFNLALDKALALLPGLPSADSALYTLAAELHEVGRRQPSRAWPDAGGAGWVLDAVQDALGAGQSVRSSRLMRVITDRWRAEGNPYAACAPAEGGAPDVAGASADPALAVVWRAATGRELEAEELRNLRSLVDSGGASLVNVLATIGEAGNRVDQGLEPAVIEGIVTGDIPMPAATPEPIAAAVVAEGETPMSEPRAGDEDPVLARVTEWYLTGVSARMTALTADELKDLTSEQRDVDVWEYAFERAKHISSSLGRWHYVRKVVLDPDMERVEHWLESGKREFKSKGDRDGGGRRRTYGRRERADGSDRWTTDDV